MRSLIVSAHDLHGGASRAAHRLHVALRSIGADSHMLVQQRLSEEPHINGHGGTFGRLLGGIRVRLDRAPLIRYPKRSKLWFSPAWLPGRGVVRAINRSKADLVHIHWIGAGMMRIEHLAEIKMPLIWTFHDMWPMTGGCHYDNGCGRFTTSCGVCPQLGSGATNDLSSRVFERKQKTFIQRSQLQIVASSRWMAELVGSSPLLEGRPVTVLPNPIDVDMYKPIERRQARDALGLPVDQKLILFGAVDPLNPSKGFDLLRQALVDFVDMPDHTAIVFGGNDSDLIDLPLKSLMLGGVSSEPKLSKIYSAADVMVVPSIQDNLPLVATEALACGTPVVAFDVTGLPDIVDHKVTGFLATPFDPEALAEGIRWVLAQPADEIRLRCRQSAVARYESKTVARSYFELYSAIIESAQAR